MMVMEYPGGSAINCYVFTVNEIIFFLTKEQTDTGYIFRFSHSSGKGYGVGSRVDLIVIVCLYPTRNNGVNRCMTR